MTEFQPDNPKTWASVEVYSPPASFDLVGYQSKLDKIAGLSDTNLPIVRLVWAGDRKTCYSKFYVTWRPDGFGVSSELRAKYRYASVKLPNSSDVIDVPPPRWILEQFEHPGQYMETWEATRFQGGREIRPAPPPNGYYSHLLTIADHGTKKCCEEAKKGHVVCWGKYRDPDETDLNIIRRAISEREKDRFVDTTKPLDNTTLDILGKETASRVAAYHAEADKRISEYIDEHAFELLEACGVSVSGRARTAFSIPGQIKKENGVITS